MIVACNSNCLAGSTRVTTTRLSSTWRSCARVAPATVCTRRRCSCCSCWTSASSETSTRCRLTETKPVSDTYALINTTGSIVEDVRQRKGKCGFIHEIIYCLLLKVQTKARAHWTCCSPLPTAAHSSTCRASCRSSTQSWLCPCSQVCSSIPCYIDFLLSILGMCHLNMSCFLAEITHRFQTARFEVRQLLPQYMLPWLVNIELVDPNVPPANPLSYFQVLYNVCILHHIVVL